ncbi:MAG: peptidylprolyl isomerase [Actinomycetota bacterium]|nr:peptidylprolyl isomerase [Actinomycetota bacterium]
MRRSPRKLVLLVACALPLALAACGGEDKTTPEDVAKEGAIAIVGDTPIPRSEFNSLMKRAEANYKAQKKPFPKPGTDEYADLKSRAVAFLVDRYAFRAEARELGVQVTDEEVDREIDKIRKQAFGGDDKKLREALEQQGLTLAQAREEVRERLLRDKVYRHITDAVKVSEDEIKDYYEKNKANFTHPASRDVRHILVKTKARADELYRRLQEGANFAELAKRFSTDTQTAKDGGKFAVTKGTTAAPFDKAAFSLPTGDISRPVKTTFGWHIIKADGPVKKENVTPLADVHDDIRSQLLDQKKTKALRDWLERLKEKSERETVYAAGFEPPKTETGTGATSTTEE